MAPDPHSQVLLSASDNNTSIPDSENDSSRRLCSFFDEIVLLLWKNCEKSVVKADIRNPLRYL